MALEQLKMDPDECVYVGDTPEDLAMARTVGMPAVAVIGPFPTEKRLRAAKPKFLVEKLQDLPALLERLNRQAAGRKPRLRG
jgi:phosphoglycolate phosphatase-like HAD superfamily hydrolase